MEEGNGKTTEVKNEGHEVDAILRVLKPWGRFQILQLFLVLLDNVPACFAILSAVFTGYIPEHHCDVPSGDSNETSTVGNITYKAHQCYYDVYINEGNTSTLLEKRTCDQYIYSKENTYAYEVASDLRTKIQKVDGKVCILVQWNLVCSRSNLAALAQSLVLAGQGIGALIMSHIADRFGRKTVHVASHIAVLCTMIVMAFSRNIYMLLILRLVAGTFQQGIICTLATLSLESFPVETRAHTSPIASMTWTFGIIFLSLFGYLFRNTDWRYLQIALAAVSVYALVEWWMLEESLRWLISNGRLKDARHILKKAARQNKVEFSKVEAVFNKTVQLTDNEIDERKEPATKLESSKNGNEVELTERDLEQKISKVRQKVKKYTVFDILRNPALRIDTLILWYTWIVAAGVYYGLTLVATHLAGNRFLNFFLSGVFEIPSNLLCFYLYNRFGRKKTLILWYAVAGVSLVVSTVLLTVLEGNKTAAIMATIFSLFGKAGISGAFSTCFLYTPEIYPTNYRNSGLGVASSVSRIGAILAPFASNLALIALWIPGAIFSGMCLLVVVLALHLPESAKHELPTTIEDFERWKSDQQPSIWTTKT